MLPIPTSNYIPKLFNQQSSADRDALTAKLDELLNDLKTDIINLRYLYDPDRCSTAALEFLGLFLNAGLKQVDTERTKRQKIYTAIQSHKNRGSWDNHAKPLIDAITGLDARLYTEIGGSDWILWGEAPGEIFPAAYYWATMGADGIDDELGLDLIGSGSEVVVAGNIYINCHYGIYVSTLTAAQIAQIVAEIELDIIPAYVRVVLGYLDSSGIFQIYDVIE